MDQKSSKRAKIICKSGKLTRLLGVVILIVNGFKKGLVGEIHKFYRKKMFQNSCNEGVLADIPYTVFCGSKCDRAVSQL